MSASKKPQLIEKALIAFNKGGYQAVGMDRLAKETGTSKTSIYKHFATKEDLIVAVLKHRDEKFRNWFVNRTEELADTPKGRLLASFDALDEWFQDNDFLNCMFIRASCEYLDHKHPIHKACERHKRLLTAYVIGLAEQAGADEPGKLARQLMLLKEGAIVTAHIHGPVGVAANAKAAAKVIIDHFLKA